MSYLGVFLLVFNIDAFARKFSSLPHGNEGGPQPQGDDRAEQKASGIQTDNYIYFATLKVVDRVRGQAVGEVGDKDFKSGWVSQNREDVQEIDSL